MTKHEKRSLQYRLARRFDLDPRRIMEIIREEIKKTPLTEEPPKGEWISQYDEDGKTGWYECSCCHSERAFNTNFCPDCGADMRGDKAEC